MDKFFIKDENGKPIFIGKEDANNPPQKPVAESSKIECPICHSKVLYLLGDTVKGCEVCYDKSKDVPSEGGDSYDRSKEISLD